MRTILAGTHEGPRPAILMALVTGSYSQPEDFVREGFPQAVARHGIDAEVVLAQLHAAWFADGSIVARLDEAVVRPARSRGHTRIWLAGVSLGGLAALGYCARHAASIEGVVLISPYPATREILREIERAGGPAHWDAAIPAGGDLEREAWAWLAHHGAGGTAAYCYFASGDRFAAGQRQIAAALPAGHSRELPGGHDWAAWRALWSTFLADRKSVLQ